VEEIRRRADGLAILAGTVPATGPGIVVTLRDPSGSAVDGALLLDTVQELRDAGAEAIQIGDQRVIVSTWFGEERGDVVVSGVPVTTPVVVTAIGDPDTMATALEIPGGIADTVRTAGGDIDVATSDAVDVTATVPAPEPQ
jgi:uncharacterized protein YlxW (UPF0749 family)